MKRVLLIFSFIFTGYMATAQQGSWYIGGVANYTSEASKSPSGFTTTVSSWAFGPEVGTFLNDDFQLGLYLGLGGSSEKDDNRDIASTSEFSPTLYGRKFFKITDNFSAFGGLYLSYLSGTSKTYNTGGGTNELEGSGFGFRLGLGVAYALSPRFTAVGQYGLLGYQNVSFKQDGNDVGSTAQFDVGVNTIGYGTSGQSGGIFNIGLYYTFKTN
jgi:hypothetical protein